MSSLHELATRYGTDKADHGYPTIYETYLAHLQHEPITLLEIGIWEGASLRMWRDYFPNATIIGIDKTDRNIRIPGINIFIQDQTDKPKIDEIASALNEGFDIVIDDASHHSSKTIQTFRNIYPHLKPGGYYFIEDICTSYYAYHNNTEHNPDPQMPTPSGKPTAMQFFKRLTDELNAASFRDDYRLGYGDLAAVHFHPNLIVLQKKQR
jgi:cephalosporin hydroxylase